MKPLDLKTSNGSLGASVFKDRVDGNIFAEQGSRRKGSRISRCHIVVVIAAQHVTKRLSQREQSEAEERSIQVQPITHGLGWVPASLGHRMTWAKGANGEGGDEWEKANTGTSSRPSRSSRAVQPRRLPICDSIIAKNRVVHDIVTLS